MPSVRDGEVGLLRDLQDLYQMASLVDLTWTVVVQAAHAIRDRDRSTPRNTIVGHAVALAAGYLSLLAFGLTHSPSALSAGVDMRRIGAASSSLAVTAGALLVIRRAHPPAGATTLIVSLGLLHTPTAIAIAFASVCLLTLVCGAYNRLSGEPMPIWAAPPADHHVTSGHRRAS